LFELLRNECPLYWTALAKLKLILSAEARALFFSMVRADPVERATLTEIKSSKWYAGEVYSQDEVKSILLRKKKL
jgi:hypothetical protein